MGLADEFDRVVNENASFGVSAAALRLTTMEREFFGAAHTALRRLPDGMIEKRRQMKSQAIGTDRAFPLCRHPPVGG